MTEKIVQLTDDANNNIYPVAGSLKQGSVTTSTINDGAVTADKIDFTTLAFGNYSTTEQDTGFTWVDGSTIYKKTINTGALPNNTAKSVAHSVSNLGRVVKLEGYAYHQTNGIFIPLPFTSTTLSSQVSVNVAGANIEITTGSDRSDFSESYVTIYYTKSS